MVLLQAMDEAKAKTLWCPTALVKTEVHKRDFNTEFRDRGHGNNLLIKYNITGKFIATTVINRTKDGEPHADCLCLTKNCAWWDKLALDCSKYNDNMNARFDDPDPAMEAKWCPLARPENDLDEESWSSNTESFAGTTISVVSANRVAGNALHPASKCFTKKCMAYTTNGSSGSGCGSCMAGDKNMQR